MTRSVAARVIARNGPGVRSALAMSRLSRGDILQILGGTYPDAHVKNQVEKLRGEAPVELGRYVAASVFDHDEGSSDEANLSRSAPARCGSSTLEGVANGLLKGKL